MSFKKIMKFAKDYAKKHGYMLNPDKRLVKFVIQGLSNNKNKYGNMYCPCRLLTGNEEKDKLMVCPCFWHKKEIEKQGRCHCGLFVSKKYYENSLKKLKI